MALEQSPAGEPGPDDAPAGPDGHDGLVQITLAMSTGAIVRIEALQADGARREFSAEDLARLGEGFRTASLEALIHEAFEAGIACVLDGGLFGEAAEDEPTTETQQETHLHDALLDALIEASPAKRLLVRETLNTAIVGTIISEASGEPAAPSAAT
jgi:hypothetical protein